MNSNETHNGWGAFQNKKKEIETLKKQLIVQDINKFGDVITLNKNNDFENTKVKVNPFRFPNKIKNEDLQKDNNIILDNDEISTYKKKLTEYNTYISENDIVIKNIQNSYEEQTNKLKIEYENKILEQKNKYNKWCLIVSGLTELISDFKDNSEKNDTTKISVKPTEFDKNETNNEEKVEEILNENEEIISLQVDEIEDINDTIEPEQEPVVLVNSNKQKSRKKSQVSEKRLKEGDTEESCLVEIDDVLYEISYKYCTASYMCYGGQIFMSNSSIVKHKGTIIDFTFDKIKNRFTFYINNKLIQINYKRPTSPGIKNVFNSNTIIRHKVVNGVHTWYKRDEKGEQFDVSYRKSCNVNVTFDEYCIYVKSKNKFFRCDINGNYNDKDEYKTLSPFIIDNYSKHNYYNNNTCQNQFEHLEYFCKKDNSFNSFNEIWHDTVIN
jgi:hypothetical protein